METLQRSVMLVPVFWVVQPVGSVDELKFSVTGSVIEVGVLEVVKFRVLP